MRPGESLVFQKYPKAQKRFGLTAIWIGGNLVEEKISQKWEYESPFAIYYMEMDG